ncbi:hypothetical protein CK503_06410 [Aliifodinibius salipaludis]|uniref:Uncharacterized protein n=1 Tax=Fodinibius salipaludis TaxID=2032627 RepID=A0A2A2GB55_9BACT|nr:hypothetical protein [Aliifodinibius salipaludis]PAU94430.1 hypothetical protein CK503_06410 [Aliifodinibius salipaludis]
MTYLKQHKKLIPLLAVAILLGIAGYDLLSEQQENAAIVNSRKMIDPSTISGRAACEVPIPDISKRAQSEQPAFEAKGISN